MGNIIDFSQFKKDDEIDNTYISPEDYATYDDYFAAVTNAYVDPEQEEMSKLVAMDQLETERIKRSKGWEEIENISQLVNNSEVETKKYENALRKQKAKIKWLQKKDYQK